MIEDIFDEVKKYAEKRMVSEESIFVDDIIEDTIEDLGLEQFDVENLSQCYDILASMSSFTSRMRRKTEEILALKIFEDEIQGLEDEEE